MSIFDENLAIVASGQSLSHASYGAAIDQFPAVLRFNRAKVKGHENDVGKFWTHWCCSFNEVSYFATKGYDFDQVVCCGMKDGPIQKYKRIPEDVLYMPQAMLDDLKGAYATSFYKPSTGLRLLWWVYSVTGKKISRTRLFGFDCFGKGVSPRKNANKQDPRSKKYYSNDQPSPRHRPARERAVYNEITT